MVLRVRDANAIIEAEKNSKWKVMDGYICLGYGFIDAVKEIGGMSDFVRSYAW